YPRARGLGGSTIHSAMVNSVADRRDFDNLAAMFNDSTWSYIHMRNYSKRIENNL
ncbi:hypothetical protein B0H17DRAFT_863934, partial [Mycena rosella]